MIVEHDPHVALLIETSHGYGRSVLDGVVRYLNMYGPWSLYFRPKGLEASPPAWLREWNGDGVLVRVDNTEMAEAVWQSGIPAVNLRLNYPEFPLPVVGLDNLALGPIAFEHLLDCGLQHFGFCASASAEYPWEDERLLSFQKCVEATGRTCSVFRGFDAPWEEEENAMAEWIRNLPKPVGVMACHDDRGLELLEACRRAGVHVPEEVAVIGVDNDDFVCKLSNPPMTSISPNAERIGFEAAALLADLMKNKRRKKPRKSILLPPGGVVPRESTDVLATEDRELAAALRFIRQNACNGLRVYEVVRATGISQKTLERRVQDLLKRSPKEEITRVQLETARSLLLETELTVTQISKRCGFSEPKYFNAVFKEKLGLPPGEYRRQAISDADKNNEPTAHRPTLAEQQGSDR